MMDAAFAHCHHKRDNVTISKQCLEMFQHNPDAFLCRFIIVDETLLWITETKEQSKYWTLSGESAPKKTKTAGKVMATVFWDARGIIHIDYFPSKQTINGDYYAALLDRFNNILKKKTSWRRRKYFSIKTMDGFTRARPNSTNSATNCFPI